MESEAAAIVSFRFEPDRCANCFGPLPDDESHKPVLFCAGLCNNVAKDIRYWRGTLRDGRYQDDPTVREALRTRIAHLLAGGYDAQARRISADVRALVIGRDKECVSCGAPGEEIDHIAGDSNEPDNLQLLCSKCHRTKTASHFVPASEEQNAFVDRLEQGRVLPDEPALLCDDDMFWQGAERILRAGRVHRIRFTDDKTDSSETLIAEIRSMLPYRPGIDDSMDDDYAARGIDDDSGYGADSYFVRAMGKGD